MKHPPKVSSLADRGQWEPILSRSRRRGTMFGGSTELPGSWGLMMKGAGGGGGGGGWDGGVLESSAPAKAKKQIGYYAEFLTDGTGKNILPKI